MTKNGADPDTGKSAAVDDDATVLGWVIAGSLFVLAGFLWYQAMPVYIQKFIKQRGSSETEVDIPGDGTIPGRQSDELAVVFFDVGYGDGFLVQAPDMTTTLIDGGEGKNPAEEDVEAYNWGRRFYLPFFQRIGLNKLDQTINTVPLSHHLGAQPELVVSPSIEIGEILLTGYSSYYYSYRRLEVEAKNRNIPVKTLERGQRLQLGSGVEAEIIYGDSSKRHPRSASHVIYLKYGSTSFLLMGDLPEKEEKQMVVEWGDSLSADVLKVGNHGAEGSTSEELLKYVQPDYAVISTSRRNPLDAPSDFVISNLKSAGVEYIYQTDGSGHVVFFTDGRKLRTKTEAFPFINT